MANWKKIIVSGSDANLNTITGSSLQLNNLPGGNTVPLVIDGNGNVGTGSAYALASGGNTVGGESLKSNVAIIGQNNGSLIQTASSAQKVDFNGANLDNINQISASNAIFDSISLSGSAVDNGSGSTANLFTVSFPTTQSAALTIPADTLHSLDIKVPVTMSNVPGSDDTGITSVLMLSSSGQVVTRSSTAIGGVTSVTAGTNLSDSGVNTGAVQIDLVSSPLVTSITASSHLFFSASSNKDYSIDFAKVAKVITELDEFGNPTGNNIPDPAGGFELSSGSLNITASGIQVSGNIDLSGILAFSGFNFSDNEVLVSSGSTQFGSGSTGSEVQLLQHQFTGSVHITGSGLTLNNGTLSIPGFNDVSASLATLGVAANLVSLSTFNSFSSSYSQSVQDFITTSESMASQIADFQSFSSSFSQSVTNFNAAETVFNNFSQSFSQSVQDFITTSESIATQITDFTSYSQSISESIEALQSATTNIVTTNGSGDVTIAGTLTVLGNTTTLTTQDLIVEDRFIYLGSGSAASDDIGIVFSSASAADNAGRMIYYDASENRFATAKKFDSDKNDESSISTSQETGNIVTVRSLSSDLLEHDILVGGDGENANDIVTAKTSPDFGEGEIVIDNSDDIWIYVSS
tara:strand:+ start:291 stop:2195 length:1905 start_codon:yes stop_codon:yes gene_type:complete